MTDVVLNTGAVLGEYDGFADPEGIPVIFGGPPQWDDHDDETGAVIKAYNDGSTSYFGNAYTPVVGNADGKGFLSFNIRWLPDNPRPVVVRFGLRVDGTVNMAGTLAPIAGSIRNDISVFRPSDVTGPFTWDQMCTAIGEDRVTVFAAIVDPLPAALDYVATVYELVITALDPVVPPGGIDPARRLWPRTDDLGLGSGRVWPPTVSPQYGNRYGAGAPL